MTVRVELEPEVEAQLLAEPRAKGLSLEAYLARLLHEGSRVRTPTLFHTEEGAGAFESWAHSRPISAPLSDDVVRPEHVLRDAR